MTIVNEPHVWRQIRELWWTAENEVYMWNSGDNHGDVDDDDGEDKDGGGRQDGGGDGFCDYNDTVWRFGVMVTRWSRSARLPYAEPG